MKMREGTYDEFISREIKPTYGWMDVGDKVVLDIGACFGAAAVFFAGRGAKKVISFEPEPDNFALLQENTAVLAAVQCVNAAVSAHSGSASFYVNAAGINKGTHTLRATRGRTEIQVKLLSFDELLEKYRPSVLKIDCEGGEYDFLMSPLPEYVKEVCIELHRTNPQFKKAAFKVVALFDGWECIKQPKLEGGHWATIGGWRRA